MIFLSKPQDFLGDVIGVGDIVVYPVRQGSRMWLVKGTVVDTTPDSIKVDVEGRKPAWVKVLSRVVIVDIDLSYVD